MQLHVSLANFQIKVLQVTLLLKIGYFQLKIRGFSLLPAIHIDYRLLYLDAGIEVLHISRIIQQVRVEIRGADIPLEKLKTERHQRVVGKRTRIGKTNLRQEHGPCLLVIRFGYRIFLLEELQVSIV